MLFNFGLPVTQYNTVEATSIHLNFNGFSLPVCRILKGIFFNRFWTVIGRFFLKLNILFVL